MIKNKKGYQTPYSIYMFFICILIGIVCRMITEDLVILVISIAIGPHIILGTIYFVYRIRCSFKKKIPESFSNFY